MMKAATSLLCVSCLLVPALAITFDMIPAAEVVAEEDGPGLDERAARSPSAEEDEATQIQGAEQHKRLVLLVIAGLLRTYQVAWPQFVRDVIEPNEAAGYEFKITLSTDLDIGCDMTEFNKTKNRKCEMAVDRVANIKEIRDTFAPRKVHLVHQKGGCSPYEVSEGAPMSPLAESSRYMARVGRNWRAMEDLQETHFPFDLELMTEGTASFGCAPWFSRVYNVLTLEQNQSFSKIMAMRTDVRLVDTEGHSAKLRIDQVCGKKQGLNFIDHDIVFKGYRSPFHNRDTDFMHLFCPGHQQEHYRDAMSDIFKGARRGEEPPLPLGFVEMKPWDGRGLFGRFASVLYNANILFTNLDESYLTTFAGP